MFLKKFSVDNYRNFSHKFEIDFSDVRDYTFSRQCISGKYIKDAIIYGKNAVGKTNFGFALFDITYHLIDAMRYPISAIAFSNADTKSNEAIFSYTFGDGEQDIIYSYRKINPLQLSYEELSIGDTKVFSFDYQANNGDFENLGKYQLDTLNWEFRENGISLLRYMANNLSLPLSHPIMQIMQFVSRMLWFRKTDQGNNFIGFTSSIEMTIDFIINNGLVNDFGKFLNECGVKEKIEAITQIDGSKKLVFKHKKSVIPFNSMASSGTQALLLIYYWSKKASSASFIFIDEFDAFYHFELAEKIVRFIEEKLEMQVVLTSHNTNLLSNRIMRPDCYFILTADKLVSFANATQRELREGHNLEKLYLSGEFGHD